ncbi:MAG TPA: hypothetical protein VI522_03570 [Gammaproteobacteria bacterium]|nr:hypothetical protein [Gammaproteobacteria bacterium]
MTKKIALLLSILSIVVFAQAKVMASVTHQGHVGATEIQVAPHTPDAIVMKDADGNDVLAVFYRVKGDHPKGGFVVARTTGRYGELNWDASTHEIDMSALRIEKFSPAPVILGDRLYVFGRQNKSNSSDGKRKLIYNSVNNNVEDLINNHWNSPTFINHVQNGVATNPDQERDHVSLVNYSHVQNNVTTERLLMSYYESDDAKQVKFSTSSCIPRTDSVVGALYCEGGKVYGGDKVDYRNSTHLIKTHYAGNVSIALLTRKENQLTVHGFAKDTLTWNNFYNPILSLSHEPMGSVQYGETLYLYYKSLKGNIIKETYAFTWDMAGETAFTHFYALRPRGDYNNTMFYANDGVKAVVFKGHIYIFYIDNQTGVLRYLIRTTPY